MRKILVVASTEFSNTIRTKAFLIGILMLPVMMGIVAFVEPRIQKGEVDTTPRRFVVADETGVLFDRLKQAADEWNASVGAGPGKRAKGPEFLAERWSGQGRMTDQERARLSDEVRSGRLFAFVEIPVAVLAPEDASGARIRYYSNHPTYQTLPRWIEGVLGGAILRARFASAGLDQALVARLNRPARVQELGLLERDARGGVKAAAAVDAIRSTVVPAAMMFLLFLPIMTITPQLIYTVLEEKTSRISEVLLGSAQPFELMMGKLAGSGAVSSMLALLYMGGAYAAAVYFGVADAVTGTMLAAFVVYMVLAMFLFGALYISVGAACTSLKDVQGLVTPIMLITILPAFTWMMVLRAPDSTASVLLSLFPPATPFLMLLRISVSPGPPLWQVILSIVLTAATTVGVIWAAGRIFRVGLLMQGKTPTFAELLRWVRA
jgi:ABC-2 type transport system permease protein